VTDAVGWEEVCTPDTGDYLESIRVPGGWIYRTTLDKSLKFAVPADEKVGLAVAMVFVPDPEAG
jgi:hypothetical protein